MRQVVSTVTGEPLPADTSVPDLLIRQILEPVRFGAAVERLAAEVDLLVEVGPGRVLSALAAEIAPGVPVVALDTDSQSLAGTLSAVAAAYVLGARVRHDQLFTGRLIRPMPPQMKFRFFASPCELAPADSVEDQGGPTATQASAAASEPAATAAAIATTATTATQSLDVLRQIMAQRAELPLDAIRADSRPLDEFHLSSITVGQIVNQAARELGVSAPLTTASIATATLAELAQMLDDVTGTALPGDDGEREPDGVAPWVRAFATELELKAAGPRACTAEPGEWQVFATAGHPLAGPLEQGLRAAELGAGVLLCLPAACDERHVGLMLEAARAALATAGSCRFVAVGDRRGATGLAKTLHLEAPAIATCAVTLPIPEHAGAADLAGIAARVVADAIASVVAARSVFRRI
jgi:enediyne polyketide synthase